MTDHITTPLTYAATLGTVILSFINTNAAALGVMIAVLTFIVNGWFRWKQLKIEEAKLEEDERKRLNGNLE